MYLSVYVSSLPPSLPSTHLPSFLSFSSFFLPPSLLLSFPFFFSLIFFLSLPFLFLLPSFLHIKLFFIVILLYTNKCISNSFLVLEYDYKCIGHFIFPFNIMQFPKILLKNYGKKLKRIYMHQLSPRAPLDDQAYISFLLHVMPGRRKA